MSHDALIDALSGYVTTDANGTVVYCNSKGEPHRLDGPAVIYASHDTCKWYRNGKAVTEEEFNACIKSGNYDEPGSPD